MTRDIDYNAFYARWHDVSDGHFAYMTGDISRWLLPHLPQDRSAKLLDFGAGMGFLLGAAQQAGYADCRGLDSDAGQAAQAQARGLNVAHVPIAEQAAWLSDHSDHFDIITMIDVLEHIPHDDQLAVMSGLLATLKPGGRLICRVPNANASFASRFRYIDWTHRTSFTEHSLDFVLNASGFADIAVISADPPRRAWYSLLNPRLFVRTLFRLRRRLEYWVEFGSADWRTVPLSFNIIAIARRPDRAG